MIIAKKDFILQKMLNAYLIIAIGDSSESFKAIIETNETGAFYWRMLEKGSTLDELIKAAMERFEDLDEATARKDISEFLESIDAAIIKD